MIDADERDAIGSLLEGLSLCDFERDGAHESMVSEVLEMCADPDFEIPETGDEEERAEFVEAAVWLKLEAVKLRLAGRVDLASWYETQLEELITCEDEECEILIESIEQVRRGDAESL
jgi:hypothetical protein